MLDKNSDVDYWKIYANSIIYWPFYWVIDNLIDDWLEKSTFCDWINIAYNQLTRIPD